MSRQIPLALQLQHAPLLDDFIVGANRQVVDALARQLGPGGETIIYLAGADGSGRTHLLLGQCAAAEGVGLHTAYLPLRNAAALAPEMLEGLEFMGLVAIDDVHLVAEDKAWEEALFALFNRCRDRGTRLLFSADRGPAALPLALPDLPTRLAWGLTLAIQPLDDAGRLQLLQVLAERRGLEMPLEVARYLLGRGPRHPNAIGEAIDRLDRISLARQRKLTIPLVRESLGL
jgi:DnaA family protein